MHIPHIQIRLQHARLSINADLGKQHIEQPGPTIDMKQEKAEQRFTTTKGKLDIDQERAWDALALGNNLTMMSRIYSASADLARQGVARIVEKGNQMAAIHLGGNPIAESAREWQRTFPEFNFVGEATYDNVDVYYTPSELSIETVPGEVSYNVQVNRPIHHYERGRLDIYLTQYPKVEIIPPTINQRV